MAPLAPALAGDAGATAPGAARAAREADRALGAGGQRRRAGAGLTVRSSWVRSFMLPGVAAVLRGSQAPRRAVCGTRESNDVCPLATRMET